MGKYVYTANVCDKTQEQENGTLKNLLYTSETNVRDDDLDKSFILPIKYVILVCV